MYVQCVVEMVICPSCHNIITDRWSHQRQPDTVDHTWSVSARDTWTRDTAHLHNTQRSLLHRWAVCAKHQ